MIRKNMTLLIVGGGLAYLLLPPLLAAGARGFAQGRQKAE